jgi:ferrous iron transport protein B
MLTASLIPCNGRLPTLLALVTTYLTAGGAWGASGVLCGCLVLCVGATLLSSRVLSATVLRGERSSFVLELPPYRMPRVGEVIVRSVVDRTLFVLGRAVVIAAPAGLVLWGMANRSVDGETLTVWIARGLQPVGRVLGLDGATLLAFLLALPAAEIFLPLLMMIYTGGTELLPVASMGALRELLTANGWTATTAVCAVIFLLFHWPCATTLLTLRREGGARIAWLGALVPTVIGALLCAAVALLTRLFI